MKITYYGHACLLVETMGKRLLFDPFITPNELAAKVDLDSIQADYILLTHAHSDHLADAESIGQRCGSTIISNYEVAAHYGSKGLAYHPLNHGGKAKFDFGTAKYVNAVHSSSFPDGSYGGNPGGFVIWNEEGTFYHAGDTALTMDMQLIPMTCPALDFAILPIGDNFTMGYEDAVIAADFVKARKVIGMHYDTFGYIKIDHAAAKKAFADSGKELILLSIGESIVL
ncbi:MAG: metal-dependent hydrolase [Bacteroidetes bacterium]|nr:MAG: metal-dependent hydrolase [Bacteroidota bacterium]PTM14128.1 MAG: metal-dependent hydrolase [Bacteroidota bacterium]